MALDAVNAGGKDAYRIPKDQRDRTAAMRLVQLMREHGVDRVVREDVLQTGHPLGGAPDEDLGERSPHRWDRGCRSKPRELVLEHRLAKVVGALVREDRVSGGGELVA